MEKTSETILECANSWIESKQKVALATVIKTWGSSPCQIGSKMIINEKGDFLGSVSGGCVEANVISECLELMKKNNSFKKIRPVKIIPIFFNRSHLFEIFILFILTLKTPLHG